MLEAVLIEPTERGLYCAAGGFYIDPWRTVDRALVTHAHSDHAFAGCGAYLCSASGKGVLSERLGSGSRLETLEWGDRRMVGEVEISLHPAGHILGSAQVRVSGRGETWVVSGDYKTQADASCEAFEPVRCDVFITESTFGLPVYRWPEPAVVRDAINRWWAANREDGRTSVILAYALGKAQRVLCGLDPAIGPIGVHGTVHRFLPHYRAEGRPVPDVLHASGDALQKLKGEGLIVAPGSVQNTPWLRKLAPFSTAFASGWMQIRGARRRRGVDRGFVLSDHADWPGLLGAIEATGADRIGVTHGSTRTLVRWLTEQGKDAWEVPTRFSGEISAMDDAEDGIGTAGN